MKSEEWASLNMQKIWTDEELDCIRDVFHSMYYFEMAAWFDVSEDHIKMICRRLGLVKKRRTAKSYHYLVPEWADKYIKANYSTKGNMEIARELTIMDTSGKTWNEGMIWKRMYHLGIVRTSEEKRGIYHRNTFIIKTNQTEKAQANRRKKGYKPGTIRAVGRKYKIVQMKHGGLMIKLGRAVWLREYGSIPPGHVIRSKSGDQYDTDPQNWMCITKAENQKLNAQARTLPPEIKELEKQLSTINSLINEIKNEH